MTDVRLTATNPEDSSVVPVACNEKGELLLEEPTVSSDLYVAKAGDTMSGSLHLGDNITLNLNGSADFYNSVRAVSFQAKRANNDDVCLVTTNEAGDASSRGILITRDGRTRIGGNLVNSVSATGNISLNADGSGVFTGDLIVGSRGKQWMIVESGGLAHLVEQTRSNEISAADLVDESSVESFFKYPPLRDIPGELTMVEEQLQKVLEKLRMVPEAGWEVWDGSDEN